ncbi:LPXTG cell wall anchor domain-containing protein [Solihabitans fulvus]|uniref:LPXTG cell wall anchor domain-containing protein n=1 Tax=Solihabitans fulvus TaxID=1892852 RepID=A0A5B2XH07_9PSEU|nr:LPXTG cell wall anchor domain-containing protein [Solihabitans fulvus]KAA2262171.1 LPXTG cell wall anchor domain-containing protein [Solihabitans fulvus]
MKFTVTNVGKITAEHVSLEVWDLTKSAINLDLNSPGYRQLNLYEGGAGVGGATIEPGATRTFDVPGEAKDPSLGIVTLDGYVSPMVQVAPNNWNAVDATLDDNYFHLSVPVTRTSGVFAGVITTDKGVGLAGVQINLSGGVPYSWLKATTDSMGRFDFGSVPTGHYLISYTTPDGWVLPYPAMTSDAINTLTIDESGRYGNVKLTAERPLSDFLHVSIALDKDTYQVGETAHLLVTLTNSGPTALTGIKAMDESDGISLSPTGPAWAELAWGGPGVTIPAGGTKTVEATAVVPAEALKSASKEVGVGYTFGYDFGYQFDGDPYVKASAKVTEATTVPTTTTTDTTTTAPVPAPAAEVVVAATDTTTADPQAATTDQLASTGANVGGLSIAALGLLTVGLGAIVFSRRRRATT